MKAIKRKIRSSLCMSLVLLAALAFVLAGSANAVTYREDFEVGYFNGAELQYHRGWFQTRSGTLTDIGNNNGVVSSYGLTSGNQSFIWIAHPFSWSDLSTNDCIILQMDLQTDGSAHFDDDRMGWNTKGDDSDSDNIFGVQLDAKEGGGYNIETYWENINDGDARMTIATLPTLSNNSWYRFESKISKVSESPVNSAKIEVKLWALDANGDIDQLEASGTINNTASLADSYKPNTRYFTEATIWPVFKNFDSISGSADNLYFHIDDGLDDVAEVEVTDNSATEGGDTGEFKLRLKNQPSQDVNITCTPYINGEDIDLGGGAVLPVTKTFTNTNWSIWQTVTVTAYNDDETEAGEVAEFDFSIYSGDTDFNGRYVAPLPVRIKIDDNDNDDENDALVAGPYIIYSNDVSKMMVLWILDSSPTCTLEWSEGKDLVPLTGSDYNISYDNSGTHGYQYRYTISSLSTSTKYYYRLTYSSGGKSYKYTGNFYTAAASSATNVKFLAYGDTRGNGGDPAYGHDSVCSGIMETLSIDPGYQSFLLQVADWVQNGNDDTDWEDNYFNRDFPNARSMLANLPVQGCTGNHEFSGTSTLFPDYWPYDEIYWPGETKHMYYYFEYGPVRIVVADQYAYGNYSQQTNRMGYDGTFPYDFENNVQLNWIKNTLSGSSKKWNFLVLHQPLYHAGGHTLDDFDALDAEMKELFESDGDRDITDDVDIVFCGHNHFYARCLEDGVRHIITGGGGAPLRDPEDPPGTQNNVKASKETFNFCEVYIRDNVLRCRARDASGGKIEAFTLLHDGTHYYVKPDGDNGSNGQTLDTAFATISYAISQAQNGDLIEVAEGTYDESINFGGKSIIVTSTDPEDWDTVDRTVIYYDGAGTGVVNFNNSEGADSILTGFTVKSNSGYRYGIYCYGASPTIRDCFIKDTYFGVCCVDFSDATIRNCAIQNNNDYDYGIYCHNSDPNIYNNWIYNHFQGVLCYYDCAAEIKNNWIYDCDYAVETYDSGGTEIIGNTIVDNTMYGVWNRTGDPVPTVTNCIVWNSNDDLYNCSATYSCIEDSEDVGDPAVTHNISPLGGPKFVNAANKNYHLRSDSPCIDAGDPSFVPEAGETDIDGEPRKQEGCVDMGADETPNNGHLYVKVGGGSDGRTWETAMGSIQEAIDAASDGDIIDVNLGTYYETIDFKGKSITLRSTNPEDPDVVANTIIDANSNESNPGRGVTFDDGEDAGSVLTGFTITGGYAPGTDIARDGGGIFCYGSSPKISKCDIIQNYAGDDGGGIFCDNGSDAEISDCTVTDNESGDKGGGMYCRNSNPTVKNSDVSSNDAGTDGGGLYCCDMSPTINRCVFSDNTAGDDGGGIHTLDCGPTITNCVVWGNEATDKGGGMYLRDDDTTLLNCTITDNTAVDGGGIYNRNSDTQITNCILWGDTASVSGDEIYNYSSTPVVSYSDVEGGWSGNYNINSDPAFEDAANGDYYLQPSSPCIDVGDPNGDYDGQTDIEGDSRVIDIGGKGDGTVDIDMGADEVVGDVHNITQDIDYFSIQTAINNANNGDVIEVEEGTYYETIDFNDKSITVTSTDPEDSSVVSNTIIDANSNVNNPGRGVTFDDGEGPSSVLTGFTITGGYAPGTGNDRDGGGILCDGSSPTISSCLITENYAGDDGGGIFCDSESDATISFCTISDNESGDKGGGMYCRNSNPTMKICDITSNDAIVGGGLYFTASVPLIEHCIISDNETTGGTSSDGGGIYLLSSDATIINSVISDNISDDDAGGIYCLTGSDANIINCTLTGNQADDKGGGIYCKDGSEAVITNCILWGNTATTGSQIHTATSSPVVSYSDVQGTPVYPGTGNINTNPAFADAYHLQSSSPCIDVGDSNGDYDGQTDIDGDSRVIDIGGKGDGTVDVDMGADEYIQ